MARCCFCVALTILVGHVVALAGEPITEDRPEQYVLRVRAFIDGKSDLLIRPESVQWRHRAFARPGGGAAATGEGPHPTIINGREWQPVWDGNRSDEFALPFRLPFDPHQMTLSVERLQVRGGLQLDASRSPVVVTLNDPESGADWYEFEVHLAVGDGASPQSQAADERQVSAVPRAAAAPAGESRGTSDPVAFYADREARYIAAQRVAGQHPELQTAWLELSRAQSNLGRLRNEGQALAREVASYNEPVAHWQEEFRHAKEWRELALRPNPGDENSALIIVSAADWARRVRSYDRVEEELTKWQGLQKAAQDKLTLKRQEFTRAEESLKSAMERYQRDLGQYQQEFMSIYREEYPKCEEKQRALHARKTVESKAKLLAELRAYPVAGEYAWIMQGEEQGTVTFYADHSFKGLSGEKKPTHRWEIAEEGIVLREGEVSWRFRPGPNNTLLGTRLGPTLDGASRKVLLRKLGGDKDSGKGKQTGGAMEKPPLHTDAVEQPSDAAE